MPEGDHKMKKCPVIVLSIILLHFIMAGCGGQDVHKVTIDISAASSLKEVISEIQRQYEEKNPDVRLNINFASSGTHQRQIEQGAPVDLFISAGKTQMDALAAKGLVDKPYIIAGNSLVLVTSGIKDIPDGRGQPDDRAQPGIALEDLSSLEFRTIAIGDPETVPAGRYAKEALTKAGIWEDISPKLVPAKDVRQVLVYVETGNADAGLVYRSDALTSQKVNTSLAIPPDLHSPIVYPAAIVKSAKNPDQAAELLAYLQTGEARAVLKKYGFADSWPDS